LPFDRNQYVFETPDLPQLFQQAREQLRNSTPLPLGGIPRFPGVGVYTIEYQGDFPDYHLLSSRSRNGEYVPIYAGKAVPRGWRTGRFGTPEQELYQRLADHSRSIRSSTNLDNSDFIVRFIILEGDAIGLTGALEAEVIRWKQPPWNTCIDGFGNHDPGSGRYEQARSSWDTLHPGRQWATRLRDPQEDAQAIKSRLSAFLGNEWQ
jgi:hypothetical protein